jgi:hypothetical protein
VVPAVAIWGGELSATGLAQRGLQHREHGQPVAQPQREARDGSHPQRDRIGSQRRGEVAEVLDTRDRADGDAFLTVKEPRPQLNRQVSLVARASPDQVEHHLGHDVEDQNDAAVDLAPPAS